MHCSQANTHFCSSLLAEARAEARQLGIPLGKLTTYHVQSIGNWYEVYEDRELVWQGRAHNAREAKAAHIEARCEQARREAASRPTTLPSMMRFSLYRLNPDDHQLQFVRNVTARGFDSAPQWAAEQHKRPGTYRAFYLDSRGEVDGTETFRVNRSARTIEPVDGRQVPASHMVPAQAWA